MQGIVPLSGAKTELGLESDKKVSGREFSFQIHTHIGGQRSWQIYADTEESRQLWIKHIKASIKADAEGTLGNLGKDIEAFAEEDDDEARPSDLTVVVSPEELDEQETEKKQNDEEEESD